MKVLIVIILIASTIDGFAQSENKVVRQGNNLYEDGKFKDAEISYRKALEKAPASTKGSYNLGNSLYKQDNYEEAAKNYIGTLNNMPVTDKTQQSSTYYNLGNSMVKAKKYTEAIDAYKNALRMNPGDNDARYNLSYALDKIQQQQNNQQSKNDKSDDKDKKNKEEQKSQPDDKQQQQDDDKNQQQKPEISKKDAERMLQALNNDEQKTLDKVNKQKIKQVPVKAEKDW